MPDSLPDAESLFPPEASTGGQQGALPDAETLFPAHVEEENERRRQRVINTGSANPSPLQDFLFSNEGPVGTAYHSAGRILHAFGHGFDEAFPKKPTGGYVPAGIPQEEYEKLKDWSGFKDWSETSQNIAKAANQVLLRPAAYDLAMASRSFMGAFTGAQAAVAQLGEEVGQPKLGRELAAVPEAFMGSPHFTGVPGRGIAEAARARSVADAVEGRRFALPDEVAQARALNVIGPDGEAGWKGTAKPSEEAAKTTQPRSVEESQVEQPPPSTPARLPAETAPPADLHVAARQIDPDTFRDYDALTQRRDTFRRWIEELRESRDQRAAEEAPHADEIANLQGRIANPDTTRRLRKKYEERLAPLLEENEAWTAERTAADSRDMANIRQRLQAVDYQMRDLAAKVSSAYRTADERFPELRPKEEVRAAEPRIAAAELRSVRARGEQEHALSPESMMNPEPYHGFHDVAQALPDDVNAQFQVHGLLAGDRDANLIDLLEHGIDPNREFHAGTPRGGAHGIDSTRTFGAPYLLLSDRGKTLRETGVKNVVLNGPAEANIDALRKAYPNVNFMTASEADEFMKTGKIPEAVREAPPAPLPALAEPPAAPERPTTQAVQEELPGVPPPAVPAQTPRTPAASAGAPAGPLVSSGNYDIIEHPSGGFLLKPKGMEATEGANTTGIHFDLNPDRVRITGSFLPEAERGKGSGLAMYKELIRIASERGLPVFSDGDVSAQAKRVYERLKDEGYKVEFAPGFHEGTDSGFPGKYVAGENDSFTIRIDPGVPAKATPSPVRTIEEQRDFIRNDVARQLIRAGRPKEEAETAGALIAARYETRAALFKGARGTAEDLYREEGAEILGPGMRPGQPVVRPPTRPRAVNEEKLSLLQFLAHRGGLKRTADLEAMLGKDSRLFREDGMTEDRAREAASEAGYLAENVERTGNQASLRDLHAAISTESRGRKVYRPGMEPKAKAEGAEPTAEDIAFEEGRARVPEDESLLSEEDKEALASGELFQFVGERAATANTDVLAKARQMADEGYWPQDIWEQTGWYRGTDGKWRFEISDDKAVLGKLPEFGVDRTLGEVLIHPQLYEAYPELANMRVYTVKGLGSAYLHPDATGAGEAIRLQGAHPDLKYDIRSHLLHEVEHAIQRREAFAQGAEEEKAGPDVYHRTAGEVEARNVEQRRDMTPEERLANPPWRTEDVPMGQQIVGAEGKELLQPARGKINLNPQGTPGRNFLGEEGVRPIITLMKDANASTFIHESGHQFLGELLRDAEHEAAPDQLKADAQTTLKWLGIEKTEDLKTSHHEKFARGFEQYLREGTAPSAGLARVFAQFKQWLSKIYETIKGLGKPINEDIRQVFDRMLAEEPQRTVIAPEREIPKTFADLHEADAETVPPEHAHPAAEAVQQERDSIAAEKLVEENNARLENIGNETRGREAGSAQSPGPGNETQPVAREGGDHPAPGAERPGGGEAQGEGAGISAEPRKAAGLVKSEPPTGAHEAFKPVERLVDKAGNFRLENISDSEDIRQAIRESVERNNAYVDERRGVLGDAEALDLADAMGLKPSDLNRRAIGEAWNKEQIIALEKLLIQSAARVSDAAKAAAEAGTEEAFLAYGEEEARQQMIMDKVAAHASGVRAEAGRALQAYNALKKMTGSFEAHAVADVLKKSTGQDLFQLQQRARAIAGLQTPAQVAGALAQMSKPGLGTMALEIYKNWLISGPITHTTYHIGSRMLSLYKATIETIGQAAASQVREAITGERGTRVYYGEVGAQLYAIFFGERDGWRAAWDSFKTGQTMKLPFEELDKMTAAERARYDTLISHGAGTVTHEQAIARLGIGGSTTPFTNTQAVPGIAGTIVRIPGERMVAPLHSFGRTVGYIQSIARQAYRQAANEGLTGNAFRTRMADLQARPSEEMMTTARNEATEQMLMGHGGEFTKRVSAFVNWEANLPRPIGPTKPISFIDPFVHIASNIMKQAVVERSPIGLLSPQLRADITGTNGRLAQDSAIGRMMAGTSLSIVSGGLAMEGLITPSAPSDHNEAALTEMVNGTPHSLRIGDLSIELNRLGVLGLQMGIAADLYHVADRIGKDEATEIASLLAHSFAHNFMDEGFMRGPSDILKAIHDPDRYGATYVRNFITSFAVPYSVGMSQIARRIDPYSRQARTTLDAMKAKVPWLSETLMPRRDIWGEPVLSREYWGVYVERLSNDPVNRTLKEIGVFPSPVKRDIRGVDLTDEQYDEYAMMAGRLAKLQLNTLIGSPGFGGLPVGQQAMLVNKIITRARETAATRVMMMWPDILREATQSKVENLTGAPETVH
jgi:hypothetical protein